MTDPGIYERTIPLGSIMARLERLDGIPLIHRELDSIRSELLDLATPCVTIQGGRHDDVEGTPAYYGNDDKRIGWADWVRIQDRLGAKPGEVLEVVLRRKTPDGVTP